VWALAQSRGDGHHSLVTSERVLSKYNKDLIFDFFWALAAALFFFFFPLFSGTFKQSSACVFLLAALFFFSIEKVNGTSIGLNFEVGNY